MRSVDDHLAAVLDVVKPLAVLDLDLQDAHGCVLAADVRARAPLPRFDNSSMDGYAVRLADVTGAAPAHPVVLPVVGDVPAGADRGLKVQPGFAVRIMTGAPVPQGADAVIPVEWTDGGVEVVQVNHPPDLGSFIRRQGEDVATGDLLLPAGTVLGAPQIALLAAAGQSRLLCQPRPRVVVVSTGSELVEVGHPLARGEIYDSNSYALTAAVREAGAIAYRVGIVPDDPDKLVETLQDHLIRADLLLTSGGVSVGAYDVVKATLARLGTVGFFEVAMQPGKPQGFGTIGADATPIFALPGNPVSSLVSFEVFVRPALRRMLGASSLFRPVVTATLAAPVRSPAGRRQFLRGRVDRSGLGWWVEPVGGAASHLLAPLARSNCLIVLDEQTVDVPAGSEVTVMLLERRRL